MIFKPLTTLVKNLGERSDVPPYYMENTIKENDEENITADCQLCLLQNKPVKETKDSSSNFFKHLKRMHPNKIEE